jgi:hypothetical protein
MPPQQLHVENLSVRDVTRWLRDRTGVKLAVATIHRWIIKGVRGTFLPSQRIGGVTYVAVDDLEAFLAACNCRRPRPTPRDQVHAPAEAPTHSSAIRRQQIAATNEALRRRLGRPQ